LLDAVLEQAKVFGRQSGYGEAAIIQYRDAHHHHRDVDAEDHSSTRMWLTAMSAGRSWRS